MAEQTCPNCGKAYQIGDEVCRYCGLVFPFSTVVMPPGSVLQGRYEIRELIHTGGMGYIYLAKDKKLYDRDVIVKQVRESIKDEQHRKKLEEEASSMARLANPNIAMILDHFVEGGYYFLVVERIEGKTLGEVYKERGGQFSEREVLDWAVTICDVVAYLHSKNVIHRDISPDNIMLMENGTLKFIDFGTSHEFRYYGTEGTVGIGKYGYTPPEQWRGKPEQRSDIFAMGATIYYLLTGYLPLSQEYITGKSPQREDFNPEYPPIRMKNAEVSAGLEGVLQKALQLEIDKRYATAAELGKALKVLEKSKKKKPAIRRKIKVSLPSPSAFLKKKAVLFGIGAVIILAGGGYWGITSLIDASSTTIIPTSPPTTQALEATTPPPITTTAAALPAQDSGDYCVEGYIYDASTGDPIDGADINLVEVVPSKIGFNFYLIRSWEFSDSTGYYHIEGFSGNGTYILQVNAVSYMEQWYENVNDREEATLLTFTPGETLYIDFLMTKSGSISGEFSGLSPGLLHINVLDPVTSEIISGHTYQVSSGSYPYLISDLPAGDYYVRIYSSSIPNIIVYYNNTLSIDTATLVHVTPGQETSNIDFDFDLVLGSISGRVVADANGQPIDNLHVYASDYATNAWVAATYTDDDGTYIISGLPEGSYQVRAVPSNNGKPYADEYYNDTYNYNMTQEVKVGFNQDVTGIDFSLATEVTISGRVVADADGQPIANVHMNVMEDYANWWGPGTNTDSNGYYTISNLPPGTYNVYASPGNSKLPYANEWYDDTCVHNMAKQVTVAIGQDATGIDFSLAPGGNVSGEVTNADGSLPLAKILVECIRIVDGNWESYGIETDGEGKYTFYGIPYGQFFLRARVHINSEGDYVMEYYPEKTSQGEAGFITVAEDSNPININFTLDGGGSISGKIISESTFEPVPYVRIHVYDYTTGEWRGCADTGADGTYIMHGLPDGNHRVYASTTDNNIPYISEYYDDATNSSFATSVRVHVGRDTPNINFILTPSSLSDSRVLFGASWKAIKTLINTNYIRFLGRINEFVLIPENLFLKPQVEIGGRYLELKPSPAWLHPGANRN